MEPNPINIPWGGDLGGKPTEKECGPGKEGEGAGKSGTSGIAIRRQARRSSRVENDGQKVRLPLTAGRDGLG